jgi:hypothetical protein
MESKKSEDTSEVKEPVHRNPKADFETMVEFYLASNPIIKKDRKSSELEIRFGTGSANSKNKSLSKIDYDNVVSKLLNAGFTSANPNGLSILRIQNEYMDTQKGETRISNIRAEIVGLDLIQEYCRTNNLQKLVDMPSSLAASSDKIKFTQKSPPVIGGDGGKPLRPVDFPDFNFRVSYQMERDYTTRTDLAQKIIAKWNDSKKLFRYINRVRFAHPDLPIFADLSIVKGSPKVKTTKANIPIPHYTIQEAGLFSNAESYEIELEIDNTRVGSGTKFNKPAVLLEAIRKSIRIVLTGLQGTHYPISNSESDKVLQTYMHMIHGEDYKPRRILPKDFIGPSSFTLQLENIQPEEVTADSNIKNIRRNYTVTDKADGERKILYVAPNGRIYMIDTNMNVIFTGVYSKEKLMYDSLIDGEHIKYDKVGKFVNLYAAFDIYYINGKSVRELGFVPLDAEETEENFRLPLLNSFISKLNPISIIQELVKDGDMNPDDNKKNACNFTIKCKQFYIDSDVSIFNGCSTILSKVKDGSYEYNTDGLIFTPTSMGVGSDRIGHAGPLYKTTWESSFKWKPPQFNTIDFLVSVKKDKTGKHDVHHIFQEGRNLAGMQNVVQYKTVELRCGFDERKHGYLNPMLDMINDQLPSPGDLDNNDTYKPVVFQPTNPYDPQAHVCNVLLKDNGSNELVMLTEEHEYFDENTIVEFRYDATKESGWKWIPLRVRYDKTNELRANLKNYGNAYHVANSNWHSIHNPITEEMISTGKNIPETVANEDVYYNRAGKDTSTRSLRDFHNLFVKRKLILAVGHRGNTLIDYAVGKAGDLPKWIAAKLGFVFGVDISKDNIENHIDGACARYLNFRKKYHNMPGALFVNGNSGLNVRSGKAIFSEKDKQITRAVFGQGPKDKGELGEGVYKRYGIGEPGFHVSSCQFAMHYFFENPTVFHQFLRNLAECTRIGGHFIGTCYDGQTVFNVLKNKRKEESMTIMREDKKIYEITKQYDQTGFPEEDSSLGYAIDVFQESINKEFREYLVNFNYFTRIMEDYGFALVPEGEAKAMGLPNSTGLFSELFATLKTDVERDRRKEADYGTSLSLTDEEKRISFMNRYFVFRKMRTINAEKLGKLLTGKRSEEDESDEKKPDEKKSDEKKPDEKKSDEKKPDEKKPKARKLTGKKFVLEQFTPLVVDTKIPTIEKSVAEKPLPESSGPVFGKEIKIRLKKPNP